MEGRMEGLSWGQMNGGTYRRTNGGEEGRKFGIDGGTGGWWDR